MSDMISRQAALDAIQQRADRVDSVYSAFWEGLKIAQDIVEKMPSAEPEQTAKVEDLDDGDFNHHCTDCDRSIDGTWNYCPFCGARLEWE